MTRAAEQELRSKVRGRLRSSTLRGVGRLLDFGGTYREDGVRSIQERAKERLRARKSDTEAIADAWQRVGRDLAEAMQKFDAETHKPA